MFHPQGVTPSTASYAYKIQDFLRIVNSTHKSILSESILAALGETRPENGTYSDQVLYSLDTEQLEKTVRAIDTKALEEGLQSMTLTSNVNSFTMKDPSRFLTPSQRIIRIFGMSCMTSLRSHIPKPPACMPVTLKRCRSV